MLCVPRLCRGRKLHVLTINIVLYVVTQSQEASIASFDGSSHSLDVFYHHINDFR